MNTNHLFASAAVAAVLVMTAPAQGQVLGGAVRGGTGGAGAGPFGGFGGMGNNNRRAAADTSAYSTLHARRAADATARDVAGVGAHAADAASGAARTAAAAG